MRDEHCPPLRRGGFGREELVDGKAINLGRCAQAGFPVPVGFTVTTEA
jgi:phosphoenolpyruvate synthase/pyruvate phosphate dikinase